MPIPLRLSTASQEIPLGYFLDSTDGNTEETGLTIANTDIKLWKAGATTLADKNSGGATHISNGLYYAVLDATDTNTIGPLIIFVHVSGALAVRVECIVYPAEVFDYMFAAAGTDYMKVDIAQVAGSNVDTAAAQLGVNVVNWKGAAASAMTGDAFARLGAPAGASVSADVAAVKSDSAAILLDTGTDGVVIPQAQADKVWDTAARALTDKAGFSLSAAGVQAIWDALTTALVTAGSIGKRLVDYITGDIFGRLGAPAGASVSADIAAVDSAIAALNNLSQAEAQAGAAAALTAYDPPTKAELDAAATLVLDRLGTPVSESIAGDITQVKTDTGDLKTLIGTPIADLAADITAVLNAVGSLNDLSVAEMLAGGVAAQDAMEILVVAAVAAIQGVDNDTLKTLSDQIDGIEAGSAPTAEEIADAVWNEILAGHLGAGSTGAALNAAGSAGDPWITEIPGAYPAGSAGYILGNRIDAAISEVLGGDLSDAANPPENSPADLLRKIFWIICNRLVIVDANGNFTAYKTDGATPAATGSIVDNGTTTVRSAPAWP